MRTFDSPGDLKDIMREIRRKTWKGIPRIDQAIFLSLLQGPPAGYGITLELTSSHISSNLIKWLWWKNPLDMGERALVPDAVREKYFNGGIRLPNPVRVNGWRFIPDFITCEYFNAARARKDGRIAFISTPLHSVDFDGVLDDVNKARSYVAWTGGTTAQYNFYNNGFKIEKSLDVQTGQMFPTFLMPQTPWGILNFETFTGLAAGNFVKIQMIGKWFFDPRLLEEDITADD